MNRYWAGGLALVAILLGCRTMTGRPQQKREPESKAPSAATAASPTRVEPVATPAGRLLARDGIPCVAAWALVGDKIGPTPPGAVCRLSFGFALDDPKGERLIAWLDDDLEFRGRFRGVSASGGITQLQLRFPETGGNGEALTDARWDPKQARLQITVIGDFTAPTAVAGKDGLRSIPFRVSASTSNSGLDGARFSRDIPWGAARRTQTLEFRAGRATLQRETGERFEGDFAFDAATKVVTVRLPRHRTLTFALSGFGPGRILTYHVERPATESVGGSKSGAGPPDPKAKIPRGR